MNERRVTKDLCMFYDETGLNGISISESDRDLEARHLNEGEVFGEHVADAGARRAHLSRRHQSLYDLHPP